MHLYYLPNTVLNRTYCFSFFFQEIDTSAITKPFNFELNGRVSQALSASSNEQQIMDVLTDLFTEKCNLVPPQGNNNSLTLKIETRLKKISRKVQ